MLEYIYVCRHGWRSNWVDPTITTGPTKMKRDPALAPYGHEQAAQLAQFISSSDSLAPYPVPEQVFTSPFYRCIETALPTYQALAKAGGRSTGLMLEHGVQEWYSQVTPNTGLHPRPGDPTQLSTFFPPGSIDHSYTSTYYPSRKGENLRQAQDRADVFVEAWTGRVEEMGLNSVVVFGHAASVILLGRALTGHKSLDVPAPTASCSLYRRKTRNRSSEPNGSRATAQSSTTPGTADDSLDDSLPPCGVGEWETVWLGRTDYLAKGSERDWSFRDAHIVNGEVIHDYGDGRPHPKDDSIPTGLAPGMEKYLRRGLPEPNGPSHEVQAKSPG